MWRGCLHSLGLCMQLQSGLFLSSATRQNSWRLTALSWCQAGHNEYFLFADCSRGPWFFFGNSAWTLESDGKWLSTRKKRTQPPLQRLQVKTVANVCETYFMLFWYTRSRFYFSTAFWWILYINYININNFHSQAGCPLWMLIISGGLMMGGGRWGVGRRAEGPHWKPKCIYTYAMYIYIYIIYTYTYKSEASFWEFLYEAFASFCIISPLLRG